MRDKIINNILIKMGSRIRKNDLEFLGQVLVEELRDVQIKKETTELAEYNDSMRKLKDMFLATLLIENKSKRTIEQYNLHLTQFAEFFTYKEVKDIDATDIRNFLYAYKQSRGISNISLNNKRSAISSFFSWLADEEYIDKDPTRKVKKIKVTKKKKKAFTSDELERMRIACTDIRDRALIEMLACTGCRVSELSNINLNDIDFTRKKVRIIGKGDKERTVFISDQAMIYLNRYLETRQDNNISLFVSKRYPYDRLRKDGIERIVRDLGRSCNVYAHPHKFRRTLCTQLIKRGMPIQNVAILLGHADINMTAGTYYDASDDMIEYEYIRYAA
ncbi:tyrosine-type recombinase/integrase [Anaerostipes hadrus]|uniref:tyrosine-type recombinase/integrase n=1 Tax=Anaerostipes hadrus TaxID=649756 RepID=UPI0015711391|nr:tyrosine-type recombinase/integrase [Anaerostipes hadrus]NSG58726.1 tyrosine-type recombinase/integrase [Anaerostipes hadrus]